MWQKQKHPDLGYNELKAEIRDGSCRRLYVLTGDEDFLIDRLVSSLSELLIATGCESLDRVMFQVGGQASRLDGEKLKAEVLTPPFLSKRKLIVVRQSGWFAASGATRNGAADNDTQAAAAASGDDEDGSASSSSSSGTASQTANQAKSRQEFLISLFGNYPIPPVWSLSKPKSTNASSRWSARLRKPASWPRSAGSNPRICCSGLRPNAGAAACRSMPSGGKPD